MTTFSLYIYIFTYLLFISSNICNSAPPLGFLPNVIIFFTDDYGYGDTESYGHPISLTPNIDQLMTEGTKLTAFYVPSPICSPSRAALLTGRFQTRSGVWPGVFEPDSVGGLPHQEITIAEFLKMNGLNYNTAIIGKWHLGVGGEIGRWLPTKQGFDLWTGIPYSHDMPNPTYCFPQNRSCWPSTPIDPWNDTCPDTYNNDTHSYYSYDPLASSQAIDYKKRYNNKLENGEQIPIELWHSDDRDYRNITDPHATDPPLPLYWNNEIIQQPVNITMTPKWYTDTAISFINQSVVNNNRFFLYFALHQTHHPQFASSMFFNTSQRGMFGDAQREMDYNIGLTMNYIKSLGIDKETLVIFTSDNGPSLMRESRGGNGGPLKCGKGTTYEGGMRIPGIFWMPGYIEQGRVSRGLGSTLDILPTIAELVDKPLPTDRYYDGISMYQWLFEGGVSKRDTFYYWPGEPWPDPIQFQQSLQAIRVNQWKLRWIIGGSHCGNNYADPDCRSSTDTKLLKQPILINLYQDVGEAYPVNVSEPYYADIVKNINYKWGEIMNTPGIWGISQMAKGRLDREAPCCQWGCDPFPSCCTCDKINNTNIDFIKSKIK